LFAQKFSTSTRPAASGRITPMWFDWGVPMIRSPFHNPASRISPRVFDQIAFARSLINASVGRGP
jgi:hypothetical protein